MKDYKVYQYSLIKYENEENEEILLYIGKTDNIKRRREEHENLSINKKSAVKEALIKGYNILDFTILYDNIYTEEEALRIEKDEIINKSYTNKLLNKQHNIMKDLELNTLDGLFTATGLRTIIDEDDEVMFHIEDVARAYAIIETKPNGKEYVIWKRVFKYLKELGISSEKNKKITLTMEECKILGSKVKPNPKYKKDIENLFGVDENVILNTRCEDSFSKQLRDTLYGMLNTNIDIREQVYSEHRKYRFDFVIPSLELVVEYDEEQHKTKEQINSDKERDDYINKELYLGVIRVEKGKEAFGIGQIINHLLAFNAELSPNISGRNSVTRELRLDTYCNICTSETFDFDKMINIYPED